MPVDIGPFFAYLHSMKGTSISMRARLNVIGALVLLAGLASASAVYLTAGDAPYGAVGYEIIDGKAYPVMPGASKSYNHDLRLYGGEAAVLADELRQWFMGLWHGRPLAYTIACLALAVSSGFFLAARTIPPGSEEGGGPQAGE